MSMAVLMDSMPCSSWVMKWSMGSSPDRYWSTSWGTCVEKMKERVDIVSEIGNVLYLFITVSRQSTDSEENDNKTYLYYSPLCGT